LHPSLVRGETEPFPAHALGRGPRRCPPLRPARPGLRGRPAEKGSLLRDRLYAVRARGWELQVLRRLVKRCCAL